MLAAGVDSRSGALRIGYDVSPTSQSLGDFSPMTRVQLSGGIAVFAILLLLTLLAAPRIAATQQLPPPSNVRLMQAGTTYTPVGVGPIGSGGTAAWFIAVPTEGDPYSVECNSAAAKCVKIALP